MFLRGTGRGRELKTQGRHVHQTDNPAPPERDKRGYGGGGAGRFHRGAGLCGFGVHGIPDGRER